MDVRGAMVSAWEALQELAAWRVAAIPRRPQPKHQVTGEVDGDLLAVQRLAALTSAYHAGGPVAFAWVRESAGGPVQVLAAGEALAAGPDGGQVMLTLPAGGRGEALGGKAGSLLARLECWVPIAGTADGLLAEDVQQGMAGRKLRPSLEDGLLAAWPGSRPRPR